MTSSPSTLNLRAADAVEETVWWYSVGISLGPNQGIGSGTGVRWAGRDFIVSARHNFVTPDVDLTTVGFFTRGAANIERVTPNEAMSRVPLPAEPCSMLRFHAIYLSEEDDLAAIHIDSSDHRWARVRFFDLSTELKTPSAGGVCILGWPASTAVHLGRGVMAVFPRPEWTGIEILPPNPERIQNYDSSKHFLAQWVSASHGVEPHGISGACFWFKKPTPPGGVWTSTDIEPIGICTEYIRSRAALKGLRIEIVIQFLRDLAAGRKVRVLQVTPP